jgi:ADP-heptose:LPS heptosyltransferase/predicted O-linked N-acetylglucosamine transferase (SPINDLY family)/2-polyprenyl-3-methyl-5-hydroxy-6-metoxy-1,4-benzoquinol methylase
MKTGALKTSEEQKMTPEDIRRFHVGTHPLIESLQIYTEPQANDFQRHWRRGIDYMRFEWISLPDTKDKELAIDLILRSDDGRHALIILAILVKEDGIYFPSLIEGWDKENLDYLGNTVHDEVMKGFKNWELRTLHPEPRLPVEKMVFERVCPGFRDLPCIVNHIKRYTFILDYILPGSVLECACGAGYGAAILSRLSQITHYHGVDLSSDAVLASQIFNRDARFSFHVTDLAEFASETYQNIVSLETIEHVPNPYRFIELLIDRMAPDGQLLLSLPDETFGGSHLNPYHLSNWNRKRLMTFLEQYFEDISIFGQKLTLLGPTTFEASNVADSPPDVDRDECLVCVLRRPRKKKRPNIILRRQWAMGDAIWATPILRELRCLYPHHNMLVVSGKTEVFMRNPDADLVFNVQYESYPDDMFVDLDWAYEKRRELHILHAYSEASGVPSASSQPALYPSRGEFQICATHILRNFQFQGIERLIAVHMAGTSPNRVWPQAHWKQFLVDLLQKDKKLGVIVLGNGQDFSAADLGFFTDSVFCLVRQLSLMHTAAVLSLCDLLVAPDSGVLHTAAAVGVPYLGLFNMADPATRLPFTTGSRALWAGVECRGCLRDIPYMEKPLCPRGDPVCMERIRPKEVLSATRQMLEGITKGRWKTRCLMAFPGAATSDSPQPFHVSPLTAGIQAFNHENFEVAIECLSTAMTQEPDNPLPTTYLAFVCVHQGLFDEARDFIAQSLRIAPERTDLIAGLGEIFLKKGRPLEAAEYLLEAVHMQPDLFAAYPALAQSLHLTGQGDEAVSLLQSASDLSSNAQVSIRSTLLQILAESGDLSGFTEHVIRFSHELPDDLLAARCLARFEESGEVLLETLSRLQGRLKDVIHSGQGCAKTSAPQSGLTRIAFMVGDFTSPQQFEQLYALFRYLPTERFFTILVSCHTHPDESDMVQMCYLLADAHLDISRYEDGRAIEKLCALTPDILIDTETCAPSGRLAVLLAAPVPYRLLWGEAPIPPIAPDVRTLAGARLSVEHMLPAVNLPEMGEVFDLPELPLTDDGARETGKPPVLGCLVPAAGIGRNGWQLFAETLRQHPDATFVINLAELGQAAQIFISAQFSNADVDPARLAFINACTAEEVCLAWQSIDLGLLPPVNPGGLALPTCLWMGRPCLVPGSILPWSQRPIALLKALGREGWVATDAPHYADLARQLATPGQRAAPDPALRERMKALGLTDAEGFARGFGDAMSGLSRIGQSAVSPDASERQ